VKRLLAALVAVAMVAGAWWIRQNVIDDGSGDAGDRLRLRCGTELAAVCQRLADGDDSITVTVEDEATTVDRLSTEGGRPEFDAWLTAGPWPAIVADERARADLDGEVLGDPSAVLARSPVTLVGPIDRMDALRAHCGDRPLWDCIGEASGQQWTAIGGQATWGAFRAGLTAPDVGAGLVALSQAVSAHLGRTDWDRLDLEESTPWLAPLAAAAVVERDPLRVLLTRPGSMSVAATLEAQSRPELDGPADRDRFTLLYPEPMVTADVTLTPAAGAGEVLERIGADRLSEALAAEGWRVGDPDLPSGPGLPSAGALQALRDEWAVLRP
jgi:hypothetical protein